MAMSETAPKGLVTKLCEVIKATGYVGKSGRNEKQNYNYVTEADVLAMLRQELADRNVFIFPSVVSCERHELYKTQSGNTMLGTDVMVKWTFVDGDTGETQECFMPGCGADTGDKGLYKAITGSSKYLFLKGFMLPTGDDPEVERKDEENANGSKTAQELVAKLKIAEANYQKREAGQVKGQVVEIYPVQIGDMPCVCFVPSAALALLLERGVKDFTIYSDNLKGRYMPDDHSYGIQLDGVAKPLGIAVKRLASAPGKPVAATNGKPAPPSHIDDFIPPAVAGHSPIIESANVAKAGFLAVKWGVKDCSCWHQSLWPYIERSVGKPAVFVIEEKSAKGKTYYNIEAIERIGNRDYEDGKPVRTMNDSGITVSPY